MNLPLQESAPTTGSSHSQSQKQTSQSGRRIASRSISNWPSPFRLNNYPDEQSSNLLNGMATEAQIDSESVCVSELILISDDNSTDGLFRQQVKIQPQCFKGTSDTLPFKGRFEQEELEWTGNQPKIILDPNSSLYNTPVTHGIAQIRKKTNKQSDESRGCTCKTTNCLRLFCKCFKTLGHCDSACRCQDCLNRDSYEEVRSFVIEKTKAIKKGGFLSKPQLLHKIGDQIINRKGCKCLKNCSNKYCQCVKLGAICSSICRCSNCFNSPVELDPRAVKDLYLQPKRRKDKIIIRREDTRLLSDSIDTQKFKGEELELKRSLNTKFLLADPSERLIVRVENYQKQCQEYRRVCLKKCGK